MRFHVVSLPHTNTTEDFTACAYTEKVRKFCIMMKNLGHTVFLYGGEFNEAPCDEHIMCITEEQRLKAVGPNHYSAASFDWNLPHWVEFNNNVIKGIQQRLEHKDFICLIAGYASKPIADAFPNELSVEFGIGYGGSFSEYKVFESYAWMHACYIGWQVLSCRNTKLYRYSRFPVTKRTRRLLSLHWASHRTQGLHDSCGGLRISWQAPDYCRAGNAASVRRICWGSGDRGTSQVDGWSNCYFCANYLC